MLMFLITNTFLYLSYIKIKKKMYKSFKIDIINSFFSFMSTVCGPPEIILGTNKVLMDTIFRNSALIKTRPRHRLLGSVSINKFGPMTKVAHANLCPLTW